MPAFAAVRPSSSRQIKTFRSFLPALIERETQAKRDQAFHEIITLKAEERRQTQQLAPLQEALRRVRQGRINRYA